MNDRPENAQVTQILAMIRAGDQGAVSRLMELVYGELRALAAHCFAGQPESQTLQPTALVHEAFIRLVNREGFQWQDRAHFFAVCATAMRGILADHARERKAAKRGGDWHRTTLSGLAPSPQERIDVIDLDDALNRLAALDERQAKVIEFRFFSGLNIEEVAHVLGVSRRTISDDWTMARAWLSVQLAEREER